MFRVLKIILLNEDKVVEDLYYCRTVQLSSIPMALVSTVNVYKLLIHKDYDDYTMNLLKDTFEECPSINGLSKSMMVLRSMSEKSVFGLFTLDLFDSEFRVIEFNVSMEFLDSKKYWAFQQSEDYKLKEDEDVQEYLYHLGITRQKKQAEIAESFLSSLMVDTRRQSLTKEVNWSKRNKDLLKNIVSKELDAIGLHSQHQDYNQFHSLIFKASCFSLRKKMDQKIQRESLQEQVLNQLKKNSNMLSPQKL